uniref:Uncharacterized protein n=1 Tax=Vespula pensylvanica TaxID=30213 RepID=A0A834P5W5_VESPE|nr:hypothetical protein H0235_006077 [Vespula pensylvanica]
MNSFENLAGDPSKLSARQGSKNLTRPRGVERGGSRGLTYEALSTKKKKEERRKKKKKKEEKEERKTRERERRKTTDENEKEEKEVEDEEGETRIK